MTEALVSIDGVAPSSEIRAQLASENRPVLLAFSGGKDAICAWLACRDAGIETVPYYMYYLPDLEFVEETMSYFEGLMGRRIHRYPHPSIYRWLNNLTFQAPERIATIEAAQLPEPTYEQMLDLIREDLGLAADTWVADGVRAADSIVRRVSIKRHGAMKPSNHKVSVVWDWRIAQVREAIDSAGIKWPVDYDWFGRSFDGLDYRFLAPLKEYAPADYQRVIDWFPLAEMELVRHGI